MKWPLWPAMDWRLFRVHDQSNALFSLPHGAARITERRRHLRAEQTLHTAGLLLHHDLLLRDSAASDDDLGLDLGTRPHVDREAEHPRVTAHRLPRSAKTSKATRLFGTGVRAHKRRQQMMVLMPM